MTKLEEEMFAAIHGFWPPSDNSIMTDPAVIQALTDEAKAAADVAKKYIEKAFYANPGQREQELCGMESQEQLCQKWLKENGVIESDINIPTIDPPY